MTGTLLVATEGWPPIVPHYRSKTLTAVATPVPRTVPMSGKRWHPHALRFSSAARFAGLTLGDRTPGLKAGPTDLGSGAAKSALHGTPEVSPSRSSFRTTTRWSY